MQITTSLRWAVSLTLILGLLAPGMGLLLIEQQTTRARVLAELKEELDRSATVMSLSMVEPLWQVSPELALPLISAQFEDSRFVRVIVNELGVMGNSSFTQRSSDTLVTGKVKAGLVDARDLYASAFKVVTERGVVYLMGRVTQREADRGTDIARSVSGVQKVVRVFEIISEEELQALLPKPAENEKKK